MKTKNCESSFEILAACALTIEEMLAIRGGDDGESSGEPPTPTPITPPIKL
jgi:hypothetical protein